MSTEPAARIYDLGYRAYDGPRRGPGWAPVTIWSHTVQRVLVVGSWAKEEITVEHLKRTSDADVLVCMDTENPGLTRRADACRVAALDDVDGIVSWARDQGVDLTVLRLGKEPRYLNYQVKGCTRLDYTKGGYGLAFMVSMDTVKRLKGLDVNYLLMIERTRGKDKGHRKFLTIPGRIMKKIFNGGSRVAHRMGHGTTGCPRGNG